VSLSWWRRAGLRRLWCSCRRTYLSVLEGVQKPVPCLFAQDVGASRFAGWPIAVTIDVRSDHNGDIRPKEANLLDHGVPLNIMKRSGLKLAHDRHKSFAPLDPASIEVDVVCIRHRRLRIGNLLRVMMIPGCIQVGKALPDCLFIARALGGKVCCRCCEKNAERYHSNGHNTAIIKRRFRCARIGGLRFEKQPLVS
jgi:hypothetical protein